MSVSMLVSCSDVQPLDSLGCQNENMSTWAWGQVLGEPMGRTWGSIVGFQFGVPVCGSSFGAAKRPPGRVGLFRVSLLESQTGPAFRAKNAPLRRVLHPLGHSISSTCGVASCSSARSQEALVG